MRVLVDASGVKTRVSYFPGMDMRLFSLYMCNKAAPKSAPKVAPEAESAPESGQTASEICLDSTPETNRRTTNAAKEETRSIQRVGRPKQNQVHKSKRKRPRINHTVIVGSRRSKRLRLGQDQDVLPLCEQYDNIVESAQFDPWAESSPRNMARDCPIKNTSETQEFCDDCIYVEPGDLIPIDEEQKHLTCGFRSAKLPWTILKVFSGEYLNSLVTAWTEKGNSFSGGTSAPFFALGSSILGGGSSPKACSPFKEQFHKGVTVTRPRILAACAKEDSTGYKLWATNDFRLHDLAAFMWDQMLENADESMKSLAARAIQVIPQDYRCGKTAFTGVALVGNGDSGFNHRHKDSRDAVSGVILTLSSKNSSISENQGMTVYYPNGFASGATMAVRHEHGRLQIGPYDEVLHAGTFWKKGRFVISFYITKRILEWFEALEQRRLEGKDHPSWKFLVSN